MELACQKEWGGGLPWRTPFCFSFFFPIRSDILRQVFVTPRTKKVKPYLPVVANINISEKNIMKNPVGHFVSVAKRWAVLVIAHVAGRGSLRVGGHRHGAIWPSTPGHGTCAFAFLYSDVIILAADSQFGATENSLYVVARGCKIHESGKYWFVVCGYHGRQNGRFDAVHIVFNATREAASLPEALNLTSNGIKGPMTRYLQRMRWRHPFRFEEMFRTTVLEVIICGRDDRGLVVGRLSFVRKNRNEVQLDAKCSASSKEVNDRHPPVFVIGERVAVDGYLNAIRDFSHVTDRVGLAKFLLEKQSQETPNVVGAPFSILALYENGPEWVERCP